MRHLLRNLLVSERTRVLDSQFLQVVLPAEGTVGVFAVGFCVGFELVESSVETAWACLVARSKVDVCWGHGLCEGRGDEDGEDV